MTDASKTAVILAYLIKNKKKGIAGIPDFDAGKDFKGENFIYGK